MNQDFGHNYMCDDKKTFTLLFCKTYNIIFENVRFEIQNAGKYFFSSFFFSTVLKELKKFWRIGNLKPFENDHFRVYSMIKTFKKTPAAGSTRKQHLKESNYITRS